MQENRPDVINALITADPPSTARPYLFFSQSKDGQAAAKKFMERQAERKVDLDPAASTQTFQAQGQARDEWGKSASRASYVEKLRRVNHPTLIVNGNDDIMVPTVNSYAMAQAIPKSQLIIYPDSGHGAIFQYADLFVQHASTFLDRSDF
jgi:pimeloyl-ACP methyl ester carboxylesterase